MPTPSALRILVVGALVSTSFGAAAADCQDGSPRPEECIAQLKTLERELAQLQQDEERRVRTLYSEEYGGAAGDGYAKEAVAAIRAEVRAWRKHRVAKCRYESLRDGMSLQYADAVAVACEVEETRLRIRQLKERNK